VTTDGFYLNGALFGRQTIVPTVTGKGWNPAGDAQSNPVVYGKLLQDASVSANTYGTVIPVTFGARRIVGAVIWAKPLIQSTTSVLTDAKGEWDTIVTINPDGPSGVVAGKFYNGDSVSQIIYRTYATFAVSFGRPGASAAQTAYRTEILVGGVSPDDPFAAPSGSATSTTTILSNSGSVPSQFVSKLWANGTLIYDMSIGWLSASGRFKLYDGSEDQLPDPIMQADKGIYCPAYRGQIYCVIAGLQVDDYGQKVPTITAEIVESVSASLGLPVGFAGLGANLLGGASDEYNGSNRGAFSSMVDFASRVMFTCYAIGSPWPCVLSCWSLSGRSLMWRREVDLTPLGLTNDWLEVVDYYNGYLICMTDDAFGSGSSFHWVILHESDGSIVGKGGGAPLWDWSILPGGMWDVSFTGRSDAYDSSGKPTVYLWVFFGFELLIYTMDPSTGAVGATPAMTTGTPGTSSTGTAFGSRVPFQTAFYNSVDPSAGFFFCRGASYRGGADILWGSTCNDGVCRVYRMTLLPGSAGWSINQIWSAPSPNKIFALQFDGGRNEVMIVYGTLTGAPYPYSAGTLTAAKISATTGAIRWTVALPSIIAFFYATPGYCFSSASSNVNGADQFLADYVLLDFQNVGAASTITNLSISNQDGTIKVFGTDPFIYFDTAPCWVDETGSIYTIESGYTDPVTSSWVGFEGPSVVPSSLSAGASGYTLSGIIQDVSLICGYAPGDVICENIDDTVTGAILFDASDYRSFLSNLASGTGFDIIQTPSNLICKRVATGTSLSTDATIAASDIIDQQANVSGGAGSLGIVQNNRSVTSTAFAGITLSRASQLEVPYAFQINYIDAQRDYQYSTQGAKRPAFPIRSTESVGISSVQLPLIVSGSQAAGYAAKALYRAWSQSVTQSFILNRKWLVLDPNDVVDLGFVGFDLKGKVVSTTIGADLSVSVALANLWTDEGLDIPVDTPSLPPPFIAAIDHTARAIVLDCPLLLAGDDLAQAALRTYFVMWPQQPVYSWPGGSLYLSTDGVTFTHAGDASLKPTIGACLTALPDADPYRFDDASALTVSFLCGDPTALSDITRQAAFSGGNLAAVGAQGRWEIVSFTTIAKNPDGTYALSGFVRGQYGTDPMTATHQPSDQFILLSGAGLCAASVPLSTFNAAVTFKALGAGQTEADVTAVSSFTELGRAEQPLRPVHLTAIIAGSDIHLGWNRRDRLDPGLVAGTGTVPLSESSEKYDIEILNGSGTVLRTVTDWVPSPSPSQSAVAYTYTHANVVADFGSMLTAGSQLSFNVYQKSAIVGRGFKATATITL
jgi:hypothetical protein